ncbi:ATP-binding protein [Nisaea sp.]|uniref:ATP-binding protein n=1 Tax=Nisaea sp. TaxID=2024842 RepID=UPI0032EBE74E
MRRTLLNWFGDLSLRAKFTTVTTFVGLTATLFATAAFLFYANTASRDALVREMTALGRITAENMGAALVFQDPGAAAQVLAALKARPEIHGVRVHRQDGTSFSEFGIPLGDDLLASLPAIGDHAFLDDYLVIVEPVMLSGDLVGTVELVAGLDELRGARNALLGIAGVITIISALIALGLSAALQRLLVRPITHLAEVMSHIKTERAYGQRAVRETNDELGELISGFNDMLARVETQHKELSVYRAHLKQLVHERTEQLEDTNTALQGTVDALRQSRDELEAANQEKTTFMANMSHELRTPLNAIIGFSEVMSQKIFGPLGSERYEIYSHDITNSGRHLLGIINQILDMTKLEAGKMDIECEPAALKEILDQALMIAGPMLHEKNISLVMNYPSDPLPLLDCDPVRVRQVIINLLSNAAKFTEGDGRVSVSVELLDDLFIRIADTGIGIAEENLERVLTPFSQVEKAYAREHHGAGLGLSLSKGLVEQHGGTLSISSTQGIGTTVTINFPRTRLLPKDVSGNPEDTRKRAC